MTHKLTVYVDETTLAAVIETAKRLEISISQVLVLCVRGHLPRLKKVQPLK